MRNIVVLLVILLMCGIAEAGLFDTAKASVHALVNVDDASRLLLMPGLTLELTEMGVLDVEFGIAGDNEPIGVGGISVNVKRLAEKRGWSYNPEEEINVGIEAGHDLHDNWFYGVYASISF